MTPALSTTSAALLGLLDIQPWSTYELAKQVDRSLGWFWPRTERKIYDEAKKLVARGYATSTSQATGSRPRTVYEITANGRRELTRWLDRSSTPPKLEAEALVRVFFADAGTLDQLRTTIEELGATARANVVQLRSLIAAADAPDYQFVARRHVNAVAMRFQLDYNQMIADWAEWATTQTESWNTTIDPASWDWQAAVGELPQEEPA